MSTSIQCHKPYTIRKLSIRKVQICNFTRIGSKTKKVMAFDNSCNKVLSASPGPTPKRCEPQHFSAALGQVIRCWKALNLGSLNMLFQQDCPKDEKITALKFLPENLEFRSTELYDGPLEGSTIFLYHSSFGHTALESYRLAELKYAIFRRTGRKTKKLPHSRSSFYRWPLSMGSQMDQHFYFNTAL